MKHGFRRLRGTFVSAVTTVAVCFSGISHGGDLSLVDAPLFLTNSVEANIFLLMDDSGSMEWDVLVDGTSSGLGADDSGNYTEAMYYVLPTANNGLDQDYLGFSGHPYTAIDETEISGRGYWRLKSSSYNRLYYDPTRTYTPWAGGFSDASPTAAPVDPVNTALGTIDLTANASFWGYDFKSIGWFTENFFLAKYYVWTDSNGDGVVDPGDGHTVVEIKPANAPFSGGASRTDCANPSSCTYAEEIQNFANWFTYYRKRSYVARAAIGEVIDNSSGVRMGLWLYNGGLALDAASISDATNRSTLLSTLYNTNFQCDSSDCPGTPARSAFGDLGEYFKGSSTPIYAAGSGGECQQNFDVIVTDGFWNGSLSAAQQARYGDDDSDNNTDYDGGDYADTPDSDPNTTGTETLADIAMYYYENDLMPGISDEVPTIKDVDEAEHQHLVTYSVALGARGTLDLSLDPTADDFPGWPEVEENTGLTVDDLWHAAFNGRGAFFSAQDPDAIITAMQDVFDSIADRSASSSSVALSSGFLNSSSLLFQARFDSGEWTGQLFAYSIISSGASAGTVGSLQWDASCVLTGGACSSTGGTNTGQDWDTGRQILTSSAPTASSNGTGAAFRWNDLTTAQQNALRTNPDTGATDSASVGGDRLEYLRGRTVSGMRTRSSLLGDITESNPVFVGAPIFNYPDSLETPNYSAFAAAHASRTPVIYVGANDGMLHGFNATTTSSGGEEVLAYVPSEVYDNLPLLTSTDYGAGIDHRYFVNASPTAGDVVINNAWKTILVGGLGKGGQGIYALDVTDPSDFDEANASSLVLWEFTDANDSDLGYTYGQPAIVRLASGDWGVVIGGGYNQTVSDGHASSDGDAVIFILDASDGSVIEKFDTKVGSAEDPTGANRPNGIATVSPVDIDGDFIVDYIYAPDLFGNVWKLDVRDSNTNQWDFAFKSGSTPEPLFVAKDANGNQLPITSPVEVGLHPTLGGQIVYFGTGKYLEQADTSVTPQNTQSFFAVWDRNEASNKRSDITRAYLLQQSITEETTSFSDSNVNATARITTDTEIRWFEGQDNAGLPANPGVGSGEDGVLGWYMDLVNTEGGNTDNHLERVVTGPILRDGKIIFVTLIPSSNPCDFGGDSWLMEVDAYSGARLPSSPFDLNGDGVFTSDDYAVDGSGDAVVSSGVKSKVGILPAPGILKQGGGGYGGGSGSGGAGKEFKYFSGSTGGIQTVVESRSIPKTGRQSWRQIW